MGCAIGRTSMYQTPQTNFREQKSLLHCFNQHGTLYCRQLALLKLTLGLQNFDLSWLCSVSFQPFLCCALSSLLCHSEVLAPSLSTNRVCLVSVCCYITLPFIFSSISPLFFSSYLVTQFFYLFTKQTRSFSLWNHHSQKTNPSTLPIFEVWPLYDSPCCL